ncbi:ABC transporter ATP-binding protein [Celerinatantimonas sp. YJH-8]|uniref:ABC transporter ATP-binding protein n=1 Tax=Celerinatantimonas sp. YJH-8 TaxID=3228714 RepID=UPI0038CA1D7C
MSRPVLRIENLSKQMGDERSSIFELYQDVNFSLDEGHSLALMGPSGSGKSTLLSIIAGLEPCTQGEIWLFDKPLSQLNDEQRAALRASHLGFVFQSFMLLPGFSALENLRMAGFIQGKDLTLEALMDALQQVGLADKAQRDVTQLSGGEQQRVALARAIVTKPRLLIADEPTGNLDIATGEKIADLMFSLNQRYQMSLLLATHDPQLARRCQRCLIIHADGIYE